jgi:hypothetical protein
MFVAVLLRWRQLRHSLGRREDLAHLTPRRVQLQRKYQQQKLTQ